jgi:uncharacterized coiled-coil DUF342 family protein
VGNESYFQDLVDHDSNIEVMELRKEYSALVEKAGKLERNVNWLSREGLKMAKEYIKVVGERDELKAVRDELIKVGKERDELKAVSIKVGKERDELKAVRDELLKAFDQLKKEKPKRDPAMDK